MKRSRRNHSSKFKARVRWQRFAANNARRARGAATACIRTRSRTWRKQLLEHAAEVFDNGDPAVDDAARRVSELAGEDRRAHDGE